MQLPSLRLSETAFFAVAFLLASAPEPALAQLRCEKILVDDVSFDLSKLGGPHSVVTSKWHPPTYTNTTYTLDLCRPLKRKGHVKKGDECPNGTRVCAIEHLLRPDDENEGEVHDDIQQVVPIAGQLKDWGGGDLDAKAERLKNSDSNSDSEKEGLRLVLNGGRYPLHGKHERYQKAIVELVCDPEKTGLEGETSPEDQYEQTNKLKSRAAEDGDDKNKDDKNKDDKNKDDKNKDDKNKDDKDGEGDGGEGDDGEGDDGGEGGGGDGNDGDEKQILQPDSALIWNSYGTDDKDNVDVLRMTWYTKYACEDQFGKPDDGDGEGDGSTGGWGFFTWLIIILFLGIAAYLIFGSWLNYNRYGARGWDLLPHGDTIRDVPYILKDWARSFLNTVQGSGARGGYSAL